VKRIQTLSGAIIIALIAYTGYNSYKLSSLKTIVEESISRTPGIELSYISTNIFSNSLEVEANIDNSKTPITAQIHPSYFASGFNYQIYGFDTYINNAELSNEASVTIKEVKGYYDFDQLTNQIDIYSINTQYTLDPSNILNVSDIGHIGFKTLAPANRNLKPSDLIGFSMHDVNILNIATVDAISLIRNLPDSNKAKIRFNLDSLNVDSTQLNKYTTIPGQDTKRLFYIFPISIDMKLESDKEIVDLLQNTDQKIDQPLSSKMSLESTSGISFNETFIKLRLKPNSQQGNFDIGLSIDSMSSVTDVEKNNDALYAYKELFSKFDQPFFLTNLDLVESNTKLKAFGKISPDTSLTSFNMSLATTSQYLPNTIKETSALIKIDGIKSMTFKKQYIKLNGKYFDSNTPIDAEKILAIKTNHPEQITAPLKYISGTLPDTHIVKRILSAIDTINDTDKPFTLEIYSD